LDYGDAPDPGYPTLSASGGACHVVPANPSLFLGLQVDTETNGQPHVNCTGDDTDILFPPANDDEDGVVFPGMSVGSTVSITVTAFGAGLLQAWLDYNQDGDWADAGEQIFTNQPLVHGPNSLILNIPASAYTGWNYARFRFSSQANIGFGGQAPDGEVEDYFIRIEETIQEPEFDILFSLDIGSDTELSDPIMDGDEVFDPGDAYLFNGAFMALPGIDGYFDDVQAFGTDPMPNGGMAGTGAPCLSGIPIDQIKLDYFDMDGLDLAECDLRQYDFGEGQPSVEQFNDPFIHTPDSMYISFDDDDKWAYSHPSGSIPRMGFSSSGMLYGDPVAKDEILEVDLNIVFPNQAQVMSVTPKYNELPIHPNLTPDPSWASANPNEHDDDVDALDVPYKLDDAARTYFSADHEAIYFDQNGIPLNPGSIYLAEGGNAYEVINAQTDIGLMPDTDVDAFEFAWLFDDQNQYNALALIFSVDEDDPMTGVDESGGLMPNVLYMSFMTGWWMDFTMQPFEDDIDALTFFASPASNQGPKADFSPINSLIFAGQQIQFTDLSTNAPVNWTWNFNGGNPANHIGPVPPLVVYANPGTYQVDLTISNAFGSDTKSGFVNVLPANWQHVPTNLSHLISIPLSANPTVNGNPLNNGDAIGVFYTDFAGNVMCGGYAIWDGVCNIALTAYADDPTTPGVKEGFVPGEDFMWEVYSWSNGQSYQVAVTYDPTMPNFDGKYYDNGMSALTSLTDHDTHSINLFKGWSGISSYLDPIDKSIVNMFNPIISDLEILLNFTGVYWPTNGINTLVTWNPYDGQIVKVNNDVTLNISGTALSNRTLNLYPGWHLIPVLSSSNSSAASILGIPGVVLAKEIGGNKVYWPSMGITSLATLETGKAYIVYVNSTVTLTFPAKASAPAVIPTPTVQLPENWNSVEPSPNTHLIAIPKDVCQTLEIGDVVAAFNTQDINTGYAVFAGENFALAVYGDDQYTTEVDGMLDGEEISLSVYRQSSGEIFNLDVVFDPEMPDAGNYATNGLSRVALKTGVEEFNSKVLVKVFPNPASQYLNIDLYEANEGSCEVMVINSIGINVYTAMLDLETSTRIDVSGWAEGCYIIRISNNQNTVTRKIIISK
jgi:PKD repeat protein